MKKIFAAIMVFSFMFSVVQMSHAQNFRGAISGAVTDQTGAVVPNASIKATRAATGEILSTISSSAGEFSFQNLAVGTYTVIVNMSGFQSYKVEGINVSGGVTYDMTVKLDIAHAGTTVQVSAAGVSLETTTVTQTQVLPNQAVQDLPLNGRNFVQLIALTPGFTGYAISDFGSVNGMRVSDAVNWQIDGTDNNDLWWNIPAVNQGGVSGIAGTVLPMDAIEQFSLETQSGPEIGRSPGGTANMVLRSGTDNIHGSAYYYNRNEYFSVQTPFAPVGASKNKIRNQQYGYSVGGPVIKDKFFYFNAFEYQTFVIGNTTPSTEPSQAYQAEAKSVLQNYGVPVDPVSVNLLNNLWPSSALTGPATPDNYFNPGAEDGHSYNGVVKFDYNFNQDNHFSARWFAGQGTQMAPTVSLLSPYYEVAPIHVHNIALIYNTVFSPHLTNQLFVGVSYFNQAFSDANVSYNPIALGLNTGVTSPSLTGAPRINISPAVASSGLVLSTSTGFDPIGTTVQSGRNDITGHLDDVLDYVRGTHEWKFGGEFRQAQVDDFYQSGQRGTFYFDGTQGPWTATPSSQLTPCLQLASKNLGNTEPATTDPNVLSLADFMAGCVSTSSNVEGDPKRQVFVNTFDLFASDNWQVSSRLNFNYGVRYDYVGPIHSSHPDLSTFLPTAPAGIAVAGKDIANVYQQYWKDISPRVGFAYKPSTNGNVVIHGALGIFFDTPNMIPFLNSRATTNGGPFGIQDNPAGSNPVTSVAVDNYVIQQGQLIFPASNGGPCQQNLQAPGCPNISLFAVSQNFRPGYVYNYSLNIQKSFGTSIVAQVGYVGNEGRRLYNIADINQAATNPLGTNTTLTQQQVTRPYNSQFPNFGVINQINSEDTSNYNALQTSINMTSWHGLVLQGFYTWSHALDEMSEPIPYLPQNSFNTMGDYGNSDYDTRQSFAAYALYNLPGLSRGPKALSHGWQVNSLLTFHSGLPFTVFANGNYSGNGENADRGDQIGPAFAGVSHAIVNHSYAQWINPNSFTDPSQGSYGTTQRNQIVGPGFDDVDLSVFKNTKVGKKVDTQFRVEMFNLFNHVNLAPPSGTIGSGFGQSTSTIGAYNGAPGIGPGEPFNTQLALKILF
jgi:hypothetical protein